MCATELSAKAAKSTCITNIICKGELTLFAHKCKFIYFLKRIQRIEKIHTHIYTTGGSDGKKICNAGGPGFDPWDWKIPRRREWLPTPVFLPRELHGQRNLVGYSLWGHKELDD